MLYHYTSARHLRGIRQFGLTVGDVPTSLARNRAGGRLAHIGVVASRHPRKQSKTGPRMARATSLHRRRRRQIDDGLSVTRLGVPIDRARLGRSR